MALIGQFLDHVVDFCEDLESCAPGTAVSTAFWFNSRIEELEQSGFKVFGKRERKRAKSGDIAGVWDIATLTVIRATNPMIIDVDAVRELVEQRMTDGNMV